MMASDNNDDRAHHSCYETRQQVNQKILMKIELKRLNTGRISKTVEGHQGITFFVHEKSLRWRFQLGRRALTPRTDYSLEIGSRFSPVFPIRNGDLGELQI